METKTEKRSSRRVSYLCDVECEGEDSKRQQTRITDLSTDGAFIDSITSYAVGSKLKLRFRVRSSSIEVSAEVRYCMPQIGVGVRFLDLSAADRDVIAGIVSEQSK